MPEMLKLGLDDRASARVNASYQLDVGGVIGQSFKVTIGNLLPFSLVGLLLHIPVYLMLLAAAALPLEAATARLLTTGSGLVGGFVGLVLTGALTFGVIAHLRGERQSIGVIMSVGARSAARVFLVSLVAGLTWLVGLALCIVPGIIVSCMLWVAVPVAVMEDAGIQESMDRSQTLTAGTRWSVFAVNLLMYLITGAANLVVAAGAMMVVVGMSSGDVSPARMAAGELLASVLLIPFRCLQAAAVAVGYHDLRVHREGAGVEDLATVFE